VNLDKLIWTSYYICKMSEFKIHIHSGYSIYYDSNY
jgi:hypothetical protein